MAHKSQLLTLMRKNWLLKWRAAPSLVFEVVSALLLVVACAYLVTWFGTEKNKKPTFFLAEKLIQSKSQFLEYNSKSSVFGYTPKGTEIYKLIRNIEDVFNQNTKGVILNFKGFTNEEEMIKYYQVHPGSMHHGVVFTNLVDPNSLLPKQLKFKVRPFSGGYRWDQGEYKQLNLREYENVHMNRGVLYMQRLVGEAVVRYWRRQANQDPSIVKLELYSQRFAFPSYSTSVLVNNSLLAVFAIVLFPCILFDIRILIYEKEMNAKDYLRLIGVRPCIHWLSWTLSFAKIIFPVTLLLVILLTSDILGNDVPCLGKSDLSLIVVYALLNGITAIAFCFMFSSFFNKVINGTIGYLIYCACSYLMVWCLEYDDTDIVIKWLHALLYEGSVFMGTRVILNWEHKGEGVTWSNFNKRSNDDDLCFLECMVMLLVDTVLYLLVYWYVSNVNPGEFGLPRPFNFCFTNSHWSRNSRASNENRNSSQMNEQRKSQFEQEPTGLKAGIQLHKLGKVFGGNDVAAVHSISLNMYEGEIFALLGNSGAGKSTITSMLTGLIPPTSGSAIVNGFGVKDKLLDTRRSLGLCPQHSVLYDRLTVKDHLLIFGNLKSDSRHQVEEEMNSLLKDLHLEEDINAKVETLSAKQRRKLAVAMSLFSGSKVVVLDEPSVGMDPESRRLCWRALLNHSQDRTILVTTSCMDEADAICNRLAIISEGVVQCSGTPLFIKSTFGSGYNLLVNTTSRCDENRLTQVIKSFVAEAKHLNNDGQEKIYLLPDNQKHNFPALFTELRSKKERLGLTAVGIYATTLEDVFFEVGTNVTQAHGSFGLKDIDINEGFTKKTDFEREWCRIKALFVKKALLFGRNKPLIFLQLVLSTALLCFLLYVGMKNNEHERSTPEKSNSFMLSLWDLSPFGKLDVPTQYGSGDKLGKLYVGQLPEQKVNVLKFDERTNFDDATLEIANEMGRLKYKERLLIGLQILDSKRGSRIRATSYYNGQQVHAEAYGVNFLMNACLQLYLGETYSLESTLHPLPMNWDEEIDQRNEKWSIQGLNIASAIVTSMTVITLCFIYNPLKEKQNGSRHLQKIAGVGSSVYWLSTLFWDTIIYTVACIPTLIVLSVFGLDFFTRDGRLGEGVLIGPFITILILHGLAQIPFVYAIHFAFRSPMFGTVSVMAVNWALVTYLPTIIPLIENESIRDFCYNLMLALLPLYSLQQCFVKVFTNYQVNKLCEDVTCETRVLDPCCKGACGDTCYRYSDDYYALKEPGIGTYLWHLAVQGVAFIAVLVFIESKFVKSICYIWRPSPFRNHDEFKFESNETEDNDVAMERIRINSLTATKRDTILIRNLFKRFNGQAVAAVDHISVGLAQNECFGLVGQNGAGKTTTLKMLTGREKATGGNAFICGADIRTKIRQVYSSIGYCPQYDALFDYLSARETLTFYARIDGVPMYKVKEVVNHWLDVLMLTDVADIQAGKYSDSNKRKLSAGIALIGDPTVILLDEPSARMDPIARRSLWEVLFRIRKSGRTVILTSHSMEEIEAVCTRVAFMVNGQLKCLTSLRQFVNKFAQGFTVKFRMRSLGEEAENTAADSQPAIKFLGTQFPGIKVIEDRHGYVRVRIQNNAAEMVDILEVMENNKSNLNIADYSIKETSLEQVFWDFTRTQVAPTGMRNHYNE